MFNKTLISWISLNQQRVTKFQVTKEKFSLVQLSQVIDIEICHWFGERSVKISNLLAWWRMKYGYCTIILLALVRDIHRPFYTLCSFEIYNANKSLVFLEKVEQDCI